MHYCIVEIRSQTATFRNPEFQNYHKTFPLPPPTTLVGLAGAALGLGPAAVQDFFAQTDFQIGIYGKPQGKTKDLWKFDDFKKRSIILREILIHNAFTLVYGAEDRLKIEQLVAAFQAPVFALTMGSSDSLAKIVSCELRNDLPIESDKIAHCVVEGDIVEEVIQRATTDPEFSIYTTSDPIALDVPTHFTYKDPYGARSVSRRRLLSFVSGEMELNLQKKGIHHQGVFIPLFSYN